MARKKTVYNIYVSKVFVDKQDQSLKSAKAQKPKNKNNREPRAGKSNRVMLARNWKEKELERLSLALEREEAECRRKRERIASLEREMHYDRELDLLDSLAAARQVGLLDSSVESEASVKDYQEEKDLKKMQTKLKSMEVDVDVEDDDVIVL